MFIYQKVENPFNIPERVNIYHIERVYLPEKPIQIEYIFTILNVFIYQKVENPFNIPERVYIYHIERVYLPESRKPIQYTRTSIYNYHIERVYLPESRKPIQYTRTSIYLPYRTCLSTRETHSIYQNEYIFTILNVFIYQKVGNPFNIPERVYIYHIERVYLPEKPIQYTRTSIYLPY